MSNRTRSYRQAKTRKGRRVILNTPVACIEAGRVVGWTSYILDEFGVAICVYIPAGDVA